MIFWITACVLCVFVCVIEFVVILKDGGIVSGWYASAKDLAAQKGWLAVIRPAFSMIIGKCRDNGNSSTAAKYMDEQIHIAFCPMGGLGDYIISAKLLEELLTMADCRIDVFCDKMSFGQAIYGNRENVSLKSQVDFEKNRNQYDLGLLVEHFVHVKNYEKKRLSQLAPKLYESVVYIRDHWDSLYVPIQEQAFRERIQFERCRVLGLDRYTELRMGKAFRIEDKAVKIPMQETFEQLWDSTTESKAEYITINYGSDVMRKNQVQNKQWTKTHYEKFVELLHKEYPEKKIYQLGAENAVRIRGCDEYLLGRDMELIKWILKKSSYHVDCEGGLVHLATQLGTRCVVLFGVTPMHMYAYLQNINIRSEKCDYCMGLHKDWAYSCLREMDHLCMKELTPELVMERIRVEERKQCGNRNGGKYA